MPRAHLLDRLTGEDWPDPSTGAALRAFEAVPYAERIAAQSTYAALKLGAAHDPSAAAQRAVTQMLADLRRQDLQIAVEVGAHPTHGSLITVTLKGLPAAARAQFRAQVQERLNPLATRHEIVWR